ncbi:Lem3/Cdc50 [Trichoderma citrinoviride]|uniref:Lem3/Cdc50 n=1 Tax=Trichoderma citrinoviride TaxID=58853 RepID=A0A2T4B4G1_9HYPO|nr:Lem3/Cdc50 [Trichoderma citrinoviride]PTB64226.1 Lem3/Cdc50 [Trichoderma citrinoviride]
MSDSPRGGHTSSIDSQEIPNKPDKKKSRRPANTAFRQQRLKAWQPILTPKTVLPLFFAIGVIFAPIGGLLLYASTQVQEIRLDYTHCSTDAPDFNKGFGPMPSSDVETAFKTSNSSIDAQWAVQSGVNITVNTGVRIPGNRCYLRFNIPESMGPPVLFYYQLTNFYQNHRRYADSFDVDQLKGHNRSYGDIHGGKCTPLYGETVDGVKKPYYPCGLIANSMFNDSYTSPELLNPPGGRGNETRTYLMENNTNIAWSSDRELYNPTTQALSEILPPPNWRDRYPNGYTKENPPPNLKEWEAFQVWMRTAGLPTFSKLYQRNDTVAMAEGRYQIIVDDFFPTTEYRGTKSIIITTRTVVGGRNNFLGIAYIVVAGLCIVLGVIFLASHLIKPRKLGDHTYLSWNNVPASKPGGSAAVASGREIRPGEA